MDDLCGNIKWGSVSLIQEDPLEQKKKEWGDKQKTTTYNIEVNAVQRMPVHSHYMNLVKLFQ